MSRTKSCLAPLTTRCLHLFWLLTTALVLLINVALIFPPERIGPLVECTANESPPLNLDTISTTIATVRTLPDKMHTSSRRNDTSRPAWRAKQEVKQAIAQESKAMRRQQMTAAASGVAANGRQEASQNLWRPTKGFRRPQESPSVASANLQLPYGSDYEDDLQISITPRVSLVRIPVESNAILKCLISAQTSKFTKPFKITWSRYRHEENNYEQIESESYDDERQTATQVPFRVQSTSDESSVTTRRLNRGLANDLPEQSMAATSANSQAVTTIADRQQQLRDLLRRSRQETNVISDLLVEATLSISPVKASDNASYFCTAFDGRRANSQARIDLLVLSKPQVQLERVQPARDSKSALVIWTLVSDGNTPIKKTILMVRNDSQPMGALRPTLSSLSSSSMVLDGDYNQWQRIDIQGEGQRADFLSASVAGLDQSRRRPPLVYGPEDNVVRADVDVTSLSIQANSSQLNSTADFTPPTQLYGSQRVFNLSSLLPGATYQLRLAAVNDMGQSTWSQLMATMPNEIPAQISDVVMLGATNDTITIGWRRPPYDSAKTIRYEMQLFDLNRTLTLDANTNTNVAVSAAGGSGPSGPMRTNFMFHFVNLNPGTDYHFHIRACSRAGCSAYSAPKLQVSTLDGEPDEPLDVELSCDLASNQLAISWLPPANTRGKLRNYDVTLEASARYRNQSGQWTSDEWRTSLETSDNHSLSLEPNSLPGRPALVSLMPNTNYTARVCASNRSKKCGKQSQLTQKSACSTPAELPRELPANIRLGLKQIKTTDVGQAKPQAETLVLELPFISARNGSIDCIQIVMIRLPSSFKTAHKPLSDYLPDDPAELELHEFFEIAHANTDDGDDEDVAPSNTTRKPARGGQPTAAAVAYLAEELDQINQSGSSEEIAMGLKQILLGDGVQSQCSQIWNRLRNRTPAQRRSGSARHSIQAIDGPLIAQTYYTGFLRLVQLRSSQQFEPDSKEQHQRAETQTGRETVASDLLSSVQLSTKYSNYFSPVKTGEFVPEVSIESLRSSDDSLNGVQLGEGIDRELSTTTSDKTSICDHDLIVSLQRRLGTSRPCELVSMVFAPLRRVGIASYRLASGFLGEHLRPDTFERLLGRSSAPLQLLEIGLFVFVVSLALLLMVYLLLLPSSLKRKRKLKMKRQLQDHEAAVIAAAQKPTLQSNAGREDEDGFANHQVISSSSKQQVPQKQQDLQALASSLGYQQVAVASEPSNFAGHGTLGRPHECPIHSSPMSQVVEPDESRQFAAQQARRQSIHVCQPGDASSGRQQLEFPASHHQHNRAQAHHHHQHRHEHQHQLAGHTLQLHHHQSAYQLHDDELPTAGHQQRQTVDYYDGRNCCTMRRGHQRDANGIIKTGPDDQHQRQEFVEARQGQKYDLKDDSSRQASYTMTLQHDPVLTLAKKVNKSIPLALFRAIFECRLKNGWLREEYEQLPRMATLTNDQLEFQKQRSPSDGRHIKLRPQLIVSRDDSVSALMSGNDKYDGSLVKLALPIAVSGGGVIEKQFICAKSPVDPDSVWDFWRLVYEREVGTLVMLTPNEDTHTGEIRCAQYWPTCDNEETTILSPCNEFVQQSDILPAKFKIRQETLEAGIEGAGEFKIRRLTLLVMATRPSENEYTSATTPTDDTSKINASTNGHNNNGHLEDEADASRRPVPSNGLAEFGRQGSQSSVTRQNSCGRGEGDEPNVDDEDLVIIERNLLHFQFLHWNASSSSNQMRLIKFIELVNERHTRQCQQQASPGTNWQQVSPQNPILVHCANGIGRSGLFTAMSFIIDDLSIKLAALSANRNSQQQLAAKLNLFQLVSRLRNQRDMLLSPYRFYELLYQMTTRCIPIHRHQQDRLDKV